MSYILFFYLRGKRSRLRITLRHYAHGVVFLLLLLMLRVVVLAEQKSGPYWDKCLPVSSLNLFRCYWHFFNFVFCNRFTLFQSVISAAPLAPLPLSFLLVSHFVAICRQTLLDWPMARTFFRRFTTPHTHTYTFCRRLMIYVKALFSHSK